MTMCGQIVTWSAGRGGGEGDRCEGGGEERPVVVGCVSWCAVPWGSEPDGGDRAGWWHEPGVSSLAAGLGRLLSAARRPMTRVNAPMVASGPSVGKGRRRVRAIADLVMEKC